MIILRRQSRILLRRVRWFYHISSLFTTFLHHMSFDGIATFYVISVMTDEDIITINSLLKLFIIYHLLKFVFLLLIDVNTYFTIFRFIILTFIVIPIIINILVAHVMYSS